MEEVLETKNIYNQKITHKAIKFENNSKWHSWKKIVLLLKWHSILYFIDFECVDDVNCNLHGSCNKETGQCVCDIGWDSELDCSGTHL